MSGATETGVFLVCKNDLGRAFREPDEIGQPCFELGFFRSHEEAEAAAAQQDTRLADWQKHVERTERINAVVSEGNAEADAREDAYRKAGITQRPAFAPTRRELQKVLTYDEWLDRPGSVEYFVIEVKAVIAVPSAPAR
ncbi:hypothetical protein ACFVAJ_17075 [Agromyces sp. NPDC057679]|uniref:hypothetical protein n=1 Tax=Agromyces sp. NPDC057679 TaxID=3346207 RepID=UPI00366B0AB7